MYLTISEFISFGGKSFDCEADFENILMRAQSYIDYYTQGRLENAKEIPDGVKRAAFEICELILSDIGDVSSYSSDGVSVTFKSKKSIDASVLEILKRNLLKEGLLNLAPAKGEARKKEEA